MDPYLSPYTKMNPELMKELTLQNSQKKAQGADLHDLGCVRGFLDSTPKSQATKEKNKLDYSKLNTFVCQRGV